MCVFKVASVYKFYEEKLKKTPVINLSSGYKKHGWLWQCSQVDSSSSLEREENILYQTDTDQVGNRYTYNIIKTIILKYKLKYVRKGK